MIKKRANGVESLAQALFQLQAGESKTVRNDHVWAEVVGKRLALCWRYYSTTIVKWHMPLDVEQLPAVQVQDGNRVGTAKRRGWFVFTPCGWKTISTRRRMNAILKHFNASVYVANGDLFMSRAGRSPFKVDMVDGEILFVYEPCDNPGVYHLFTDKEHDEETSAIPVTNGNARILREYL